MKMAVKKFTYEIKRLAEADSGAVTVDWVVLTAAVVGLLAAGFGNMRDGALDLTDRTSELMASYLN